MSTDAPIPSFVETLVLGAGLAGLSAAYHLKDRVLVAEAAGEVGGAAGTLHYAGFHLDRGVHILYFCDPWTSRWLTEELAIPLLQNERRSAVWLRGCRVPFPMQFHLAALPATPRWKMGLSALGAILRAPHRGECRRLSEWANAYWGAALCREFFRPYNEKLWATPFNRLGTEWMNGYVPAPSVRALLRGMLFRQAHGFGRNGTFWYPVSGGIGTIATVLTRRVGAVHCGLRLKTLDLRHRTAYFTNGVAVSYQYLVSTIPLPALIQCVDPAVGDLPGTAAALHSCSTTIAHLLLCRPDGGEGLHWVYVPDPAIPFYRITFPRNINPANCPEGRWALTLEFGGCVPDRPRVEQESKDCLARMGMMHAQDRDAEVVWDPLDYGYVTYDEQWAVTREQWLTWLRKYDVVCLGRYGRWEYSNMESALLQGRRVRRRLVPAHRVVTALANVPANGGAAPVHRYFAERYPSRSDGWGTLLFRRGEGLRLRIAQGWLPHCEGLDVLDAGCGDGIFAYNAIHGQPLCLRLEDFISARVEEARRRLFWRADVVEARVTDVRLCADARQYDVVLALGLFDYETRWEHLLECLLRRTRETLIADFPKASTLHSRLRRVWLAAHGVRLHCAPRPELTALFAQRGLRVDIVELPLHWMVKIHKEV